MGVIFNHTHMADYQPTLHPATQQGTEVGARKEMAVASATGGFFPLLFSQEHQEMMDIR